jgi:hypothetical protein
LVKEVELQTGAAYVSVERRRVLYSRILLGVVNEILMFYLNKTLKVNLSKFGKVT